MVREVSNRNELGQILASTNQVVVIDYYAPWCGPCKRLSPFLEQAQNTYRNILFLKVNTENGEYPDVTSLPTVQFVQNNKQISISIGYNPQELTTLLSQYN